MHEMESLRKSSFIGRRII